MQNDTEAFKCPKEKNDIILAETHYGEYVIRTVKLAEPIKINSVCHYKTYALLSGKEYCWGNYTNLDQAIKAHQRVLKKISRII